MNQESTSSSMGPMLLTFLAGAAVGAVVVALTTPKTGQELRGDLKDLARRAKRKAGNLGGNASEAWDHLTGAAVAGDDLKHGVPNASDTLHSWAPGLPAPARQL